MVLICSHDDSQVCQSCCETWLEGWFAEYGNCIIICPLGQERVKVINFCASLGAETW